MSAVNDGNPLSRPCVILAHPDVQYATRVGRSFRRRNWAVHSADTAEQVRQLARNHGPELIVLAADLRGESGWLACDKLNREFPSVKVVLVVDELTAQMERFAEFVGATALLSVHSAFSALLDVVRPAAVV